MHTRELDQLFDRYRREGDVAALASVFDATSKELFAVALHLARDAAEAEDLVQETYLAAIERAWSYDCDHPLVPWLVGITTIAARRKRKLAARTIDAERLPRRSADDPEHALAARELDDALRAALAELPPKYREVVELHLEHGRKPAEIAQQLALPPGNVRVQLHRGLELLRRALPASLALGALAPLVDERWLDRVRSEVLARADAAAGGLASEGRSLARESAQSAAPATAMKTALVAVAALLPIVVGWSWFGRRSAVPRSESAALVAAPALAAPALSSAGATLVAAQEPLDVARGVGAQRSSATPIAADASALLVVHVSGLEKDATGVVKLVARLASGGEALTAQLAPAASLSIDVSSLVNEGASAAQLYVMLDHADYLPAQVATNDIDPTDARRPRVFETSAHLTRAIGSVHGRVVGVESLPTPNAFTAASDGGTQASIMMMQKGEVQRVKATPIVVGLFRMQEDGRPDSLACEAEFAALDGSFHLRTANDGEHLLAISAQGHRIEVRRISIHEHDSVDVGDIAPSSGETLTGRVTGAADARVNCDPRGSGDVNLLGQMLTYCDGELDRTQTTTVDKDGRFRFEHLVARLHRVTPWASPTPTHRNDSFSRSRLEVYDRARFVDVTPPASGIELTLRTLELPLEIAAGGVPARDLRVEIAHDRRVESGGHTDENGRIVLEVHGREPFSVRIQTGAAPDRDIELDPKELVDGRMMQIDLGAAAAGTRLSFDVDDPLSLRVNLTALEGLDDEARARILHGVYLDREPRMMMRPLDEHGELAERVPAGRWAVDLRPAHEFPDAGEEFRLPARFKLDLGDENERRVPAQLATGGRLLLRAGDFVAHDARVHCELVDARDATMRVRFARSTLDANGHASMNGQSTLDLAGPSFTSVLPAGTYRLRVWGESVADHESQVTVVAGRTSEVTLNLQTR